MAAAMVMILNDLKSVTWEMVQEATTSDPIMFQLVDLIENGFPLSRHDMPNLLHDYYSLRDGLHTHDGVILYNNRIVIPPSLRQVVLKALHSAHQGVSAMIARAKSSVFWPGITTDIRKLREKCTQCDRIAPSQPCPPPTPPVIPLYPFQSICADFFHHAGCYYLVVVDRYSNWPIVKKSREGSKGLITTLREIFVTYGISEDLTTDGGPEFVSYETKTFLKNWGVRHRLSSVAYPHSNCRAEVGVKSVKRILIDNTGPNGSLSTDAFGKAMLNYRNTPTQGTELSPSECLFGRPIRDFIPVFPIKYEPHPTWRETLKAREEALRVRHMKVSERLNEHTKHLTPLKVGDSVRIQNQTGPHPTKWHKTGRVIEVRQFDQYVIRVDGSGRVTLRNRKFLRKFTSAVPRHPITVDLPPSSSFPPSTVSLPSSLPSPITPSFSSPSPSLPSPVILSSPTSSPSKTLRTPSSASKTRVNNDTFIAQPPNSSLLSPQPPSSSSKSAESSNRRKTPRALTELRQHNAPGLRQETETSLPKLRSMRKLNF